MSQLRTTGVAVAVALAVGLFGSFGDRVVGQVALDAQSPDESKQVAADWIDSNADILREVNRNIWTYAEVGLEETQSATELMNLLRRNGFTIEMGLAGMQTAFVASYGAGEPVVGILAEYDALPGLSQDAVPLQQLRVGATAGHACGHSVFGTASTAAAIAVRQAIEAGNLNGTIKLYGTPAEETVIGKTYMLRDGYFRDDDVILTWHAADRTAAGYAYTKALVSVKYRFTGLASHASVSPHQGRSALDAVELMTTGVNYMREHIKEDARIHYVITDGGGQPNVVPPEAEVWYYIRADKHADVEEYFAWVNEIAEAAAMMTRTELSTVQVDSDVHEVLPNRALARLIHENLERVGPPLFTEAEKAFARQTQEPLGRRIRACPVGNDRATTGRAGPDARLDRRGGYLLVRAGRKPQGRLVHVWRSGTQLADCRLHGHDHRRKRHVRRCQDTRRYGTGPLRHAGLRRGS